jgi:hypothetical protein
MFARAPVMMEYLFNLPYVIVLLWLVWLIFVPGQVAYLLRKNQGKELSKTGELMNFREVMAVGCLGGFILLTFITAYCCYLTFDLAGLFDR